MYKAVNSAGVFDLSTHLLQSLLFLIDNVLYQHGYRVDPGYGQTERHHMFYHKHKPETQEFSVTVKFNSIWIIVNLNQLTENLEHELEYF